MLPLIEKREAGQKLTEEERRELIDLGRGMSAHLPGSADDFLREKHEDTEREEARRVGGTFFTTDKHELDRDEIKALCPIEFIR